MAAKAHKSANGQTSRNGRAITAPASHTLLSKGKAPRSRSHIPNSRHRWTEYLDAQKGFDLVDAATHASRIGRPLNQFVTIHFERANLSDLWRPQDAISAWLKLAGQWLGLRDVPCTFLWVMEHAPGTGLHVHILLHCPPNLRKDFKAKGEGAWLRKAGMAPAAGDRHAIHFERVGPRGYDPATAIAKQRGTYHRQLKGLLRYHLEGLDPDQHISLVDGEAKPITELLGVEPSRSIAIYGRRASRSQNIGKTARDRFHAQLDRPPT